MQKSKPSYLNVFAANDELSCQLMSIGKCHWAIHWDCSRHPAGTWARLRCIQGWNLEKNWPCS